MPSRNRVEVLHGVNFDMLGSRNRLIYGDFTLPELEVKIKRFASDLSLVATFFQSNEEGEFVEHLHRLEIADAAIVNAGARITYSSRSATLSIHRVPPLRSFTDISNGRRAAAVGLEDLDLVVGRVYGKGPDGYREALELIAANWAMGLND